MDRWKRVFDRSQYRCVYCGVDLSSDLRIWHCAPEDHLYPKCLGGADSDANLVASCQLCNSLKGNFVPPLASAPGVVVLTPDGGKEVDAVRRPDYIAAVSAEITRLGAARQAEFEAERKRIGR
jgi:hypothetical protein